MAKIIKKLMEIAPDNVDTFKKAAAPAMKKVGVLVV